MGPRVAVPFYFPSTNTVRSSSTPSSPEDSAVAVLYFSHFGRCALISLHFLFLLPQWLMMGNNIFTCLSGYPLWRYICSWFLVLFLFFAHFLIDMFVFWVLRVSKNILNTSPLSDMCFTNISPHLEIIF